MRNCFIEADAWEEGSERRYALSLRGAWPGPEGETHWGCTGRACEKNG